MKYFFLLGVNDPEMTAIKALLVEQNQFYFYATKGDKVVCPDNAYSAEPVMESMLSVMLGDKKDEDFKIVYVECAESILPTHFSYMIIDHHRPGDPGYELPPAKYWEASSLGQVYKLLDIEPTSKAHILAAMDHCFYAATRGECPGISVKNIIDIKLRTISINRKNGDKTFFKDKLDFFRKEISASENQIIGSQTVKDFRHYNLGVGYSVDLLIAQVAAAIDGYAALFRHRDREDQSEKNTLTGNVRPETVEAFINQWGTSHGLVRIYGVPTRGFAGGYKE